MLINKAKLQARATELTDRATTLAKEFSFDDFKAKSLVLLRTFSPFAADKVERLLIYSKASSDFEKLRARDERSQLIARMFIEPRNRELEEANRALQAWRAKPPASYGQFDAAAHAKWAEKLKSLQDEVAAKEQRCRIFENRSAEDIATDLTLGETSAQELLGAKSAEELQQQQLQKQNQKQQDPEDDVTCTVRLCAELEAHSDLYQMAAKSWTAFYFFLIVLSFLLYKLYVILMWSLSWSQATRWDVKKLGAAVKKDIGELEKKVVALKEEQRQQQQQQHINTEPVLQLVDAAAAVVCEKVDCCVQTDEVPVVVAEEPVAKPVVDDATVAVVVSPPPPFRLFPVAVEEALQRYAHLFSMILAIVQMIVLLTKR